MILAVVFSSCVRNKNGQVVQSTPMSNAQVTNAKVFEVKEVVQANNYSYLKVKEKVGRYNQQLSILDISTI